MSFHTRRLRKALKGLRWLDDLPLHHDDLALTPVRKRSLLIPVGESDGAILIWGFNEMPGLRAAMMVRLTEREADAVFSADPYTVGMLEPVRRKLEHRWAILAVVCGKEVNARPYRITKFGTEDAFVDGLDAAVDSCPSLATVSRRDAVPAVQLFAEGVARDLAIV